MASVFKATYRRKDPKTGKIVTRRYKKWSIKYKDETGKWKVVPGFRDKEASIERAKQLEKRADRIRVGIHDPFEEHRRTELGRHIEAFKDFLNSKGDCEDHVLRTIKRVRSIANACEFAMFDHISASSVAEYLSGRRNAKKGRLSKKTSNYYLAAFQSFCRWMVKDRRSSFNPVVHLAQLNTEDENSRPRRVLSAEQFANVIECARSDRSRVLPKGSDRAALYMVAAFTGFRAQELSSLRPMDFDLKSGTVTCGAAYSKRRRRDVQPLREDLVQFLGAFLNGRNRDAKVWPGRWYRKAAAMLRHDLNSAGIPYKDEFGRFFDFHAIRHSYITNLHRGGTYGKVLQSLARHSTPVLTARYTHVELNDIQAALSGLPSLAEHISSDSERKQA